MRAQPGLACPLPARRQEQTGVRPLCLWSAPIASPSGRLAGSLTSPVRCGRLAVWLPGHRAVRQSSSPADQLNGSPARQLAGSLACNSCSAHSGKNTQVNKEESTRTSAAVIYSSRAGRAADVMSASWSSLLDLLRPPVARAAAKSIGCQQSVSVLTSEQAEAPSQLGQVSAVSGALDLCLARRLCFRDSSASSKANRSESVRRFQAYLAGGGDRRRRYGQHD